MNSFEFTSPRLCEHCKSEFEPKSSPQQRFCSVNCVNLWRTTSPDYFWSKVVKSDGCWLWTGSQDKDGYGKLKAGQKTIRAHRYCWIITYGPIPDGLGVLHTCDNPVCVRPAHLFTGTKRDNVDDMVKKNRQAKGDRNGSRLHPERVPRGDRHPARLYPERMRGQNNGRAKLTDSQVYEIRRRCKAGEKRKILCEEFGLGTSAMGAIIRGEHWSHLL